MSDLKAYTQYLQGVVPTNRVVVVDGNNILFAPDAAAARLGKMPLTDVIQSIVTYVNKALGGCPVLIDIVVKNLPTYDPEDYLLALRQTMNLPVILSYTDLMDWRRLGSQFREFDDFLTLKKVVAYSELLGPKNVILLSCDGYNNYAETVTVMGKAEARLIERNYILGGSIVEYLHKPNVVATDILRNKLDVDLNQIHRLTNQPILQALGFPRQTCSSRVSQEVKITCSETAVPQLPDYAGYLLNLLQQIQNFQQQAQTNPQYWLDYFHAATLEDMGRTLDELSRNLVDAALAGNWNYVYKQATMLGL
jgi:hypothetical protein